MNRREGPAEGWDAGALLLRRVVADDEILDVLVLKHAAEGVDPRRVAGVAVQLGTIHECWMHFAECCEIGDLLVKRMIGVEAVARTRRGADDHLARILLRLGGEHVLTSVLVTICASETLLVTVVDDGIASGEEHEIVRELDALQQFVSVEALAREHHGRAAHVVIAGEGGQLVGVGVVVGVVVVECEQVSDAGGAATCCEVDCSALEREVERGLQFAVGGERRDVLGVAVEDLSEHEEILVVLTCRLEDARAELLPELEVHVLDGVDTESVDTEVGPCRVDVDHSIDDFLTLGEEVVEAEEVAISVGFAGPGRVTAVVVHRRIIEPFRHLHRSVFLTAEHRGMRERRLKIHSGELPADVVTVVERIAVNILVGLGFLRDVVVVAVGVVDHVCGVVGDDVEEDLHAASVRSVNELAHLLVRAEVWINLGEICDPVAVVTGSGISTGPLDWPVLEARREPDGSGTEAFDVVELLHDALEVATVVEALVRRVEAVRESVALNAAGVVAWITVGETIGEEKVELLVGECLPQRRSSKCFIGCRRGTFE